MPPTEVSREEDVGLLGLGAMGGRFVVRLLASGRRVFVYDPSEAAMTAAIDRGADACASPSDVAARAETVLLSLPTPAIVREVACGADGLTAGARVRVCVDLSTSGPAVAREVAERLAAAGIAYIDAPVSGGVTGATDGTLTAMVACDETALEAVRPLLALLTGKVFRVGATAGMGQLAKVINNLLSATALVASAEAVALGVGKGLDAQVLLDVLNASSGRNSATAQKLPDAVLTRSFDFGFALSLMDKDVQICLSEARAAGLDLPVAEAVAGAWAAARAALSPEADCTEIVRLVERQTGTKIASRPPG